MSEPRQFRDPAAGREAPEALEHELVAAFREHHAWRRAQGRRLWGGLAAAVAIAAVLAVVSFVRLRPVDVPVPPTPPLVAKGVVRGMEPTIVPPAPPPAPPLRTNRHRRAEAPRPAPPPRQEEVTTGFMPLDASGTLPASGEVIRMQMPRSTLTMFGLPVNEQRLSVPVRADVLFGEDGRAHAVRFVTTTSFETQPGR